MAIPEWMEPQWRAIEAADSILKKLRGKKGRTVRPTEPVEMGGDGKVVDLGEVIGRRVSVELTSGVEIEIGAQARIVQTPEGKIRAIAGGRDQAVTVYDAGRILGRQLGLGVKRAIGRDRGRKRRNIKSK